MRKKILFVLPLFFILIVGLVLGTKLTDQPRLYKNTGTNSVLGVNKQAGQIALNVEEKSITELTDQSEKDSVRVHIVVELKNESDAVLQVSPGLNLMLIDVQGFRYFPTMKFHQDTDSIGGPINSSQTMNVGLDYVIPKNTQVNKIVYFEEPNTVYDETEIL